MAGLKRKLWPRWRNGITTIVIPNANVKDLEEIPKNLREQMEFKPVKTIEEVLAITLESAKKSKRKTTAKKTKKQVVKKAVI